MATTQVSITPEALQASQHSERNPDPCIVVIFGASGDLTKRKLLPALYHLEQAGNLPEKFAVVGVARRSLEESFAPDMKDGILAGGGVDKDDPRLDPFVAKISYHAMNFDDGTGYDSLKTLLAGLDEKYGTQGNRLFYLATAPEYFSDIIKYLGEHGMAQPEEGATSATGRKQWIHTIIEKPFGHDLESAKALNDEVNKVFREDQIFRIDHYLGKETVQNILVFRFANGIFENVWNRNYIDHIEITAAEAIGIEGRGPFYEGAGALRDVVQNHVMELLSFRHHGAPRILRGLRRPCRKDQGLGRPSSPSTPRTPSAASTAPASSAANPSPAIARRIASIPGPRPRPTPPSASKSRTGAGPVSQSIFVPASA